MRKTIIAALLTLLLCVPVNASFSWKPIITRTAKSIVFLGIPEEHCSGFVINQKKNYVLTASHCKMDDGTVMLVDGIPSAVVKSDDEVMILVVPGLNKPKLRLAAKDPKNWDNILLMGYQTDNKLLRATVAMSMSPRFTDKFLTVPMLIANDIIIPGESGGPVINTDGAVVGMNQAVSADLFITAATPSSRLKEVTAGFWDK